jgi:hypothetical protein
MGGAMTYSVVSKGMQQREVPAPRADTFWIVLDSSGPLVPLRIVLPDGREALALFSGEEEAKMFCSLREAEGDPHLLWSSSSCRKANRKLTGGSP